MAFLYERFATWRALVHATRDPKKLAIITVATTAAFGGVAYGLQGLTDRVAAANEEVVRSRVARDREAARYAAHSKRALEVVLAQAQGQAAPEHRYPMKMPAVHWHPDALARSGDYGKKSADDARAANVAAATSENKVK